MVPLIPSASVLRECDHTGKCFVYMERDWSGIITTGEGSDWRLETGYDGDKRRQGGIAELKFYC